MRTCAKMRCDREPVATVVLAYEERAVLIEGLAADRDPDLLDLCRDHAALLTPPVGWSVQDRRDRALAV